MRITVNEARIIANGGEIQDVVNCPTEKVQRIADILWGADHRRRDIATAASRAQEELDFRRKYNM